MQAVIIKDTGNYSMKQHKAIVIIVNLLDSKTQALLPELYVVYRKTSKTAKNQLTVNSCAFAIR